MANEIVFDIETEKEFREVGGRNSPHLLGVTVVGIYNYEDDRFSAFEKHELTIIEKMFKITDRIIGFNIRSFDIPVLEPHVKIPLRKIPMLDLMDDVEMGAGFRISLDNLAQATLGEKKSGTGLDALRWWREGKKDKVKEYCLQDVRVTRNLYEFGKKNGHVFYVSRTTGEKIPISVKWQLEKNNQGMLPLA
ncbi:ribonuclease H-like domain-containing protein [Patescibacteria group bacterium]